MTDAVDNRKLNDAQGCYGEDCFYFCLTLSNNTSCSFLQAKYISTCIDEIKQELKQDNIAVKANAVCKLTYVRPPIIDILSHPLQNKLNPSLILLISFEQLQMLGYDVSWAAFNIVEVMSSSKFTYKVRGSVGKFIFAFSRNCYFSIIFILFINILFY